MMGLLLKRRAMMMPEGELNYLKFTALEDNSSVALTVGAGSPTNAVLEYSLNEGTWMDYTIDTAIALDTDDEVRMRRKKGLAAITALSTDSNNYYQFAMSGSIAASGNVMFLLDAFGRGLEVGSHGFRNLFEGCTSLLSSPDLPATKLGASAYVNCFRGCSSLLSSPYIPANILGSSCFASMFNGCNSVVSHHFATLNSSSAVFNGNSSCTSFRIDAPTPPAIISNTISGLNADCIIYVPAGSVAAYQDQSATYWYDRRDYIRAIP